MNIIIYMEGGVIHEVVSDGKCNVVFVDYDIEGVCPDNLFTINGSEVYMANMEGNIRQEEVKTVHEMIESRHEEDIEGMCEDAEPSEAFEDELPWR